MKEIIETMKLVLNSTDPETLFWYFEPFLIIICVVLSCYLYEKFIKDTVKKGEEYLKEKFPDEEIVYIENMPSKAKTAAAFMIGLYFALFILPTIILKQLDSKNFIGLSALIICFCYYLISNMATAIFTNKGIRMYDRFLTGEDKIIYFVNYEDIKTIGDYGIFSRFSKPIVLKNGERFFLCNYVDNYAKVTEILEKYTNGERTLYRFKTSV